MNKKKNDPDRTRPIVSEVRLPDGDLLVPQVAKVAAVRCDPSEFAPESSAFDIDERSSLFGSTPFAVAAVSQPQVARSSPAETHNHGRTPDCSAALEELHLTIELVYMVPLEQLLEMRATWRRQVEVFRTAGRLSAATMREAIIVVANERLRPIDVDNALGATRGPIPDHVSNLLLN